MGSLQYLTLAFGQVLTNVDIYDGPFSTSPSRLKMKTSKCALTHLLVDLRSLPPNTQVLGQLQVGGCIVVLEVVQQLSTPANHLEQSTA